MYIPSFDFRIFDLPLFSPLQAGEFGAATSFSANTPTSFIDYSINQLSGLRNQIGNLPSVVDTFSDATYFQSEDAVTVRDRAIRVRDQAQKVIDELGGDKSGDCKQGRNIFGGCGPILGSKPVVSDGQEAIGDKKAPPGMDTLESGLNALKGLPQGAGIFLVAVAVIILLLLFVKR